MSASHHLVEALDTVDAALFSGPALYIPEERALVEEHLARWTRRLAEVQLEEDS